jgi:outer membrane protein TolC
VRLAETKEAAIVAENSAERALGGLRVLLGLEMRDPLELKAPQSEELGPPSDLGMLLEKARNCRMELIAAEQQIEAAKARVREAVAGYHPEVSVFGGFSFEDRNIADFKYGNWFWGVSFVYSIFNIFRTPYFDDQAVAERAAAYAAARKALLGVELDVNNALLDGEEADARHDVASQAVDLAGESLRLVEAEYKEGAATITRLLEAELSLTQARTRLSATTYDRSLSRIVIAHAVGEYPAKPDLEKAESDTETGANGDSQPTGAGPEVSSPTGAQSPTTDNG